MHLLLYAHSNSQPLSLRLNCYLCLTYVLSTKCPAVMCSSSMQLCSVVRPRLSSCMVVVLACSHLDLDTASVRHQAPESPHPKCSRYVSPLRCLVQTCIIQAYIGYLLVIWQSVVVGLTAVKHMSSPVQC